jgi:chromosome segregation ATPase
MSVNTHRACVLLALSFASASLQAQSERSGGGSEAQKIMQQYQQLAGEKTALQAQVTQMKQQLDAANSELASVKKERDALKARSGAAGVAAAQLAALKQSTDTAAEKNKQRMTELESHFRETLATLKGIEVDRGKLKDELRVSNEAYDRCAVDNLSLFELNDAILTRYEHVGLFTKAAAVEPFTRITRTRIDNLVDEYRARAEELRAKARAAAGSPP